MAANCCELTYLSHGVGQYPDITAVRQLSTHSSARCQGCWELIAPTILQHRQKPACALGGLTQPGHPRTLFSAPLPSSQSAGSADGVSCPAPAAGKGWMKPPSCPTPQQSSGAPAERLQLGGCESTVPPVRKDVRRHVHGDPRLDAGGVLTPLVQCPLTLQHLCEVLSQQMSLRLSINSGWQKKGD